MNKETKISALSTSTQELNERKTKKKSKKRKRYSSSDSDSDDRDKKESKKRKVSTSSDSDSYHRKKKKKHKHKRKKEKSKKLKKEGKIAEPNDNSVENVDRILLDRAKAMAPMTKEEWEKRQNVVRRVYDKETNRHRLIKGDGEVLEEIVSKERHKEINRKASKGDGEFFQSQISTFSSKS